MRGNFRLVWPLALALSVPSAGRAACSILVDNGTGWPLLVSAEGASKIYTIEPHVKSYMLVESLTNCSAVTLVNFEIQRADVNEGKWYYDQVPISLENENGGRLLFPLIYPGVFLNPHYGDIKSAP